MQRPNYKTIELPVLPLRGLVLFPGSVAPIGVGRPEAAGALAAVGEDKLILCVTQREPGLEHPTLADLHPVGTLGVVQRVIHTHKGEETAVAVIAGIDRVSLLAELASAPYLRARAVILANRLPAPGDTELGALTRSVKELFAEVVSGSPALPAELAAIARNLEDVAELTDFVAGLSPMSDELRQQLLETLDVRQRLQLLTEILVRERQEQRLTAEIRSEVEQKVSGAQREYFLREQLHAIRKQLGEDDGGSDLAKMRAKLDEAGLPEEARREADRELARLEQMEPAAAEYVVARTYLEWLGELPWTRTSAGAVDMRAAERILDEDHYGLAKVKERILELLAVLVLKQGRDLKAPILCLVGPPGVGKTSLGKSIARATGREFIRLSLGGMRDEAEIRGHRRTYVGALPGQIIRGLRRAATRDPVFMLDEVDKIGQDFRGDPAAALLEVLDPEQNFSFRDHYLDVPFDLSRVLFITTANVLDPVAPALRDRMEVLELPGYVEEEKVEIAERYLIPRQIAANGLVLDRHLRFTREAVQEIIRSYTAEAGVRHLEQSLASVCRKRARQIATDAADTGCLAVTVDVVHALLGPPSRHPETNVAERSSMAGVAVALAWTPDGGDVLFVESSRMPRDKGEFIVTGQVREVMQESARAAMSWVRAHAQSYGIDPTILSRSDVHIHVPSGGVPKDGPSAGIAIVASLVSLFTGRPLAPLWAMTGEITLSGRILPVGGVKEKVLAARRAGIEHVVLPASNEDEVEDAVPAHLRGGMVLHFVTTIDEALRLASASPAAPGKVERIAPVVAA